MKRFLATGMLVFGVISGFWYANTDNPSQSINELVNSFSHNRDGSPQVNGASFFGSDLFSSSLFSTEQSANGKTFRVASFRIDLDEQRSGDAKTIASLARIMSNFDVIALQGLQNGGRRELNNLVDLMNHGGRRFAFALGPDVGSAGGKAFVYDQQRIILDTQHVYTVADPDDLFQNDPLVGWFMARGPREEQAFTFTLVNIQIDEHQPDNEIAMLAGLYRAVRDDGRGEDDVILLGDLRAGDQDLRYLHRQSRLSMVVREQTTDTEGTFQSENIMFYPAASVEQTGRGGVFDFLKEFNLTINEAVSISPYLPVWTEFQVREAVR